MKIIKKEDEEYPKKLLDINKSPECLYVLGDETLLNKKSIAIVGSRDCTEYGYKQSKKFAQELSKKNVCIVSGMAIGIDTAAHIGSKDNIGKTIAILGGGFNDISPRENEELFYEILNSGGCIVSEYEPNTKTINKNFPKRNRIISGLSEGVLVVEAKYRSGARITARYAKEQGKKVYCIPSNIESKTGYGTGILLQNGAKIVLSPNDILKDLNISSISEIKENKDTIKISKEYKVVYDVISKIPININEICRKSNKNICDVNAILTMLELQGLVKQTSIGEFIKVGN